jgi:hypothetical protein
MPACNTIEAGRLDGRRRDARTPVDCRAMFEKGASLKPCTNCGADAADIYCPRCGERQPGHHDLGVAHFAHEVFHEIAHVDSKLFMTLRDLITKPGFLTEEYFAGRKSRYIPALRLFFVLFALQFLAFTAYSPAALYTVKSMKKFDTVGALHKLLDKKAKRIHVTADELDQRIDERFHKNYSLLQLVNIAGLALVLKVLYYRRYLAEHLVFSAHFLAFSYILSLVLDWPIYAVVGLQPGLTHQLTIAVTIGISLVYLFLAQRRFYGESPASTAFKTAILWGGRFAIMVLLLGGSLAAAILTVH